MRLRILLAGMTLIGACAPADDAGRWNRPAAETSDTDRATCRGEANRRAEREFLLDTGNLDRAGDNNANSVRYSLARIDAERYRQRLYEDCLRGFGHRDSAGGKDPGGIRQAR